MKKSFTDGGKQLSLPLKNGGNAKDQSPKSMMSTIVVPFVDAQTMQIRQTATARVAASGIFAIKRKPK